MLVTTSGLAFDTGMPVPINSGGSTAVILGLRAAMAALTGGLLAQTIEIKSSSWVLLMIASMSMSFSCRSEWLIKVPMAPASLIDSASMWPVKLPYLIGSMCCAKTGIDAELAIEEMSVN